MHITTTTTTATTTTTTADLVSVGVGSLSLSPDVVIPESPEAYITLTESTLKSSTGRLPAEQRRAHASTHACSMLAPRLHARTECPVTRKHANQRAHVVP